MSNSSKNVSLDKAMLKIVLRKKKYLFYKFVIVRFVIWDIKIYFLLWEFC